MNRSATTVPLALTVTLTPSIHLPGPSLRHLLFKPTNQSGATFDIDGGQQFVS